MTPELKARWLDALTSGIYLKTTGTLKNAEGYCCLGVLACEAKPEIEAAGYSVTRAGYGLQVENHRNKLPNGLLPKLGLTPREVEDLMTLNDEHYNFDGVLKYIEEKL